MNLAQKIIWHFWIPAKAGIHENVRLRQVIFEALRNFKVTEVIRSIRVKFTLWYIGSFFVLLLLSSVLGEIVFRQFAVESIDQGLQHGAQRFEQALAECFVPDLRQQSEGFHDCFDKQVRSLFPYEVVLAQLRDFSEQPAAMSLAKSYTMQDKSFSFTQEAYQALRNGSPFFETLARSASPFSAEIRMLTQCIHDAEQQPYILQFGVFTSQENIKEGLRPVLAKRPHILFLIFPVLLILTGLLGYIFMKRAFAPVHQLSNLAKNISAEDLSHRIDSVQSNDEIGELADTFNEMIARLEHSFQQINQFSGDVSHELKTPLTAIKGEIEVALRKERTPEEYQQVLASVLEDSGKLQKIVENLLFLSRMDARSFSLSCSDVALDELLLEVYEESYLLAEDKQIRIDLKQVEQIGMQGDAGLLKRVFINLLMNAIKYTPPKGRIEISLEYRELASARVTIADSGIGIPEASLPHIFDRFYRVDASRTQETGGSGLGLAIAQKIVEAHGGSIEVQSQEGQGTRFRILFRRGVQRDTNL